MKDIKKLLAIKANIETVMQRDIDPLMRVVMQRRLDKVCEEIEKACAEWDKLFEPQEIDQLQAGVKELKNENKQLRELVCEFAHYLDCPAYFLRPETEKTIIDIAAEERAGR